MGIVASVASFLLDHHCNIVESAQFGDPATLQFFMRVSFDSNPATTTKELSDAFAPIGNRFELQWSMHDAAIKPRLMTRSIAAL